MKRKKSIYFLFLSYQKSGYKLKFKSSKLSGRGEIYYKKAQQFLYGQKRHRVQNTGKEKNSIKNTYRLDSQQRTNFGQMPVGQKSALRSMRPCLVKNSFQLSTLIQTTHPPTTLFNIYRYQIAFIQPLFNIYVRVYKKKNDLSNTIGSC